MNERPFDLQERFIDYAVRIIKLSGALPETKAGKHICSQALRSGTSPAPKRRRSDSDTNLEYWIFLVGYWIFRKAKGGE